MSRPTSTLPSSEWEEDGLGPVESFGESLRRDPKRR